MAWPRTRALVVAQDRAAALVGLAPGAREEIILGLMRRDAPESTAYWLQLVVAAGIAVLGLVLGSTAVIIGAMLIAPLMAPIVALAMGLAIGSPLLVLRATGRIAASVVVVVALAAGLTALLPYHEVNVEIAARTAPTLLDLVTAGFCALAGAYAAMRPGSDVASTAAGTSIGISLVPPLCASGFGFGTGAWQVASGAALLFLANVVAIVGVGMVAFVVVGFNQVNTLRREESSLDGGLSRGLSRRVAHLFASGRGAWLRALMPLALLALVYVPLRDALDEVAWQVRARRHVERAVAELPQRVVQSRVRVERGRIELALVLLGSTDDAEATRAALETTLRGVARSAPRVEVFAVPDAAAFAALESTLRPVVPAATPPAPGEALDAMRARLRAAVERRWPADHAGVLVDVALELDGEPARLTLTHLGPAVGAAGVETLRRSLRDDLGRDLAVDVRALPAGELTMLSDAALWSAVDRARANPRVWLCVERPPPSLLARLWLVDPAARRGARLVEQLAGGPRIAVSDGAAWSAWLSLDGCPASAEP